MHRPRMANNSLHLTRRSSQEHSSLADLLSTTKYGSILKEY